jgi:uncharacterized membrane protein YfhO
MQPVGYLNGQLYLYIKAICSCLIQNYFFGVCIVVLLNIYIQREKFEPFCDSDPAIQRMT